MDKLDSYGDNFRNVPICVPNETEKDAQTFKEISKSFDSYCSSQTSCVPTTDNRDGFLTNLCYGHKKKSKKEKKDSKR